MSAGTDPRSADYSEEEIRAVVAAAREKGRDVIEKSRQVYAMEVESLRRAVRAGVAVAYGTDSGVQPHGENGKQLALYVEAGMSPLQALQSATTVAARLLRMEKRIGKIQKGFAADLIAVRDDPLQNIRTIESPLFVMKEGILIPKKL